MSQAQRLVTCLLLFTACGRGQLDGGGFTSRERRDAAIGQDGPAFPDAGFFRFDSGFDIPDAGFMRFDTGVGPGRDGGRRDTGVGPGRDASVRDTGVRDGGPNRDVGPDGSVPLECRAEPDCFVNFGIPRCPNGPGRWSCIDGLCEPDCAVSSCMTDCDCPFDLSCTPMGCAAINRPNFCCASPTCLPGQTCIEPDGMLSQCGGAPDAGSNPDASIRRDSGVPFDSSVPPDSGTTACMSDCDCDPSTACIAGQCRPAGRNNQCCTNPMCMNGDRCVNPDGSPGICGPVTPVGESCDPMGPQCGPNGFCIDEGSGFPGGYCTQGCDRRTPCPPDSECRGGGGNAFCLDSCVQPADCRAGYNCINVGVGGNGRVCWPNPPTSMNPNGDPVGAACGMDEDCGAGLTCLQQQGFRNGYCTRLYCDPVTAPCPSASACYAFPGLFSLCLSECTVGPPSMGCRMGYYCLGPAGGSGVCVGI